MLNSILRRTHSSIVHTQMSNISRSRKFSPNSHDAKYAPANRASSAWPLWNSGSSMQYNGKNWIIFTSGKVGPRESRAFADRPLYKLTYHLLPNQHTPAQHQYFHQACRFDGDQADRSLWKLCASSKCVGTIREHRITSSEHVMRLKRACIQVCRLTMWTTASTEYDAISALRSRQQCIHQY